MNTIDIATIDDLPLLCDLLSELFLQESEFVPNRQRQVAGLRAIIGHPDVGRILVMRDGFEVIGMVTLLFVPSTALGGRVALLEDMVVSLKHRSGGVGSQLLAAAIQTAETAGCLRITLLTDRDNSGGQRFYERHGFLQSAMIPMRLMLNAGSP